MSEAYAATGRNREQQVARAQLLVHESGALGAEQDRDALARDAAAISRAASRGSTTRHGRCRAREVVPTISPQSATASRTSRHDCARRASTSSAPGRQRGRFVRREARGRHQHKLLEPHGLHRAGGRADVAGVRGADEHDADGHALLF